MKGLKPVKKDSLKQIWVHFLFVIDERFNVEHENQALLFLTVS